MALGTLLTATVKGEREGTAVVNILVDAPSSSVQEITLNSLKITYEGDGDGLFDMVLQPSSCTIGIEVDRAKDTWLDTFLNGIIGNENEYFIEVLRNGSREWIGKVLLDISEIEDSPIYTYNMTATCGLGTLKDFDFDFALNPANGTYLVVGEVLRKALLPTYTDVAYSASDNYITSMCNFFEQEQLSLIGTKCPLEINRIARVSLIEDVEENEPLNCADVIERILRPFGVRIRMQLGRWFLVNPIAYTQPLVYAYNYGNRDYSLGPLSVGYNAHETNLDGSNNIDTISGNTFTYKPALVRVDVKYKPESKIVLQKAYNTSVFYPNFDVKDLDTNPIKISGKVQYEVPRIFNGITNAVNGTVRLTFIVKALAGATEKYRLDYTSQSSFYWTTNLNSVCVYDFSPVTDSRAVDEQSLSIDMPILVDTSITNLSFEIYVNNLATSCSQALDWGCTLVAEQLFDNGTYEDDIAYTTDNTVLTNNSVYKEYEIYHGDNANSLVLSAFQSKSAPAAVWSNSVGWLLDYDPITTSIPIGQLLSKQIMNFGRVANKTYQCTLYYGNSLTMFNTLVYGAEKYFINSGEFDYKTNDFTGDIIQLNPILTGSSSTTGKPFRSGIDRLRSQVGQIDRNIGDINVGIGRTNGVVRDLIDRVTIIEGMLTNVQPLLSNMINLDESYTPGTAVPLNITINQDGSYTITTG